MNLYLSIKLLLILSATLVLGTGMGTAFLNEHAMAVTTESVVLADWIFTTPAIVVQFAAGLWLTQQLGISFRSTWFVAVIGLFFLVGACWIPVVWIQIRIRKLACGGADRGTYRNLMRAWVALGIPTFASVLVIFYLMVTKVGA